MLIKNSFLTFIILFLLTSCLSPVSTPPINTYVINTVPQPTTKKPYRKISLLVMPVEADPLFATKEMAYSTHSYQIDYFAKNEWASPPAKMLQPLLIQTLQRTHYFYALSSAPSIGVYNYVLHTELLQLQQLFSAHPSVIQLTLRAQLINGLTNQIIATRQFTVFEIAPTDTPYGGVIAANRATGIALRQLARFCVSELK